MNKKRFLLSILIFLGLFMEYRFNILKPNSISIGDIKIKLPKKLDSLSITGPNIYFYGICLNCLLGKQFKGTTYISMSSDTNSINLQVHTGNLENDFYVYSKLNISKRSDEICEYYDIKAFDNIKFYQHINFRNKKYNIEVLSSNKEEGEKLVTSLCKKTNIIKLK